MQEVEAVEYSRKSLIIYYVMLGEWVGASFAIC